MVPSGRRSRVRVTVFPAAADVQCINLLFVLFLKLTELLQWYAASFRDPMMLQPPEWFKAFIYCEAFLQMPFFPVAVYAFFKGWYDTGVSVCPVQRFYLTLASCAAEKVYLSVSSSYRAVRRGVELCCSHGKF